MKRTDRFRCLGMAMPLLVVAAVYADDPPQPNLEKPVNYVAWINERFHKTAEPNAAELYQRAFEVYVEPKDLPDDLPGHRQAVWSEEQLKPLKHWVRANKECLTRFELATRVEHCYFVRGADSGDLCDTRPTYAAGTRGICKLLSARARLRLYAGRVDASVRDICTILRAARHVESNGGMIDLLVASALREPAYAALLGLPALGRDAVDYPRVLSALREADRLQPDFDSIILLEQLGFWDALQRHGVDDDGDGHLERVDMYGIPPIRVAEGETFDSLVTGVEQYFVGMRDVLGQPGFPKAAAWLKLAQVRRPSRPQQIPSLVDNTYLMMAQMRFRALAARRAARIILGIHASRARTGRWPRSLDETPSDKERSFRIDPFSGADFEYRRVARRPKLYSVGINGKDDGGRWARWGETDMELRWTPKDGDYIFWPLPED